MKAISQGQDFKANLVREIERVGKLSGDIEKEAALISQYSLKRMEINNEKLAAGVREYMRGGGMNRADLEYLSESIAQKVNTSFSGLFVNSFLSHISSNPALDPRIGGEKRACKCCASLSIDRM